MFRLDSCCTYQCLFHKREQCDVHHDPSWKNYLAQKLYMRKFPFYLQAVALVSALACIYNNNKVYLSSTFHTGL